MPTLRLLPELEDALRQIPGVRAASVVTGPDATPTEVHVLALPGKPAKQVVRDVQSLSMARFNIDIDHRIVSVVQIGDQDQGAQDDAVPLLGADGNDPGPRPSIAAIMVRTSGGMTEATVTLAAGDVLFEGRSEGPASTGQRARLIAAATVDAVDDLLGQPCEVESAIICSESGRAVALSVLSIVVPRTGTQLVTGCALVRGDEADAVARSVLAALNRRLVE